MSSLTERFDGICERMARAAERSGRSPDAVRLVAISKLHGAEAVAELADHPHVAEIRQRGMILAIEMVKDKTTRQPFPWQERRGLRVYEYGLRHEALLRPLGNVVYWMPPYIVTENHIAMLADVTRAGINEAVK